VCGGGRVGWEAKFWAYEVPIVVNNMLLIIIIEWCFWTIIEVDGY